VKLCHDQLHRFCIPSSKDQKIISKAKINDPQMFTLGVKIKIRNIRQLVEGSMQVLHDNNKKQWGDRVPLSESTSSLHEASVSAMNVEFVGDSSNS
jgi:hypothetical protein